MTAIKLTYAATTWGTNDVFNFTYFADYVHQFGPIGIYGHWHVNPPYNHPPLVGWMLYAINMATIHLGLPFRFLIRLPATFADIITTLLVFELVRRSRSLRDATVAALVVALSPVLIIVSGYHGNTDPAFVMFALLSFYLLVKRWSGIAAGLCFGISVSIKLIPIVTIGVLLVLAFRAGRRKLAAFVAGAAAVFVVVWLPVVAKEWTPLRTNVLGYAGYGGRPRWGLPEFFYAAGASQHMLDVLEGPVRFVLLLVCIAVPALIAWRNPAADVTAFGLSLSIFFLLSTATASQYFAWAAAATVLINCWAGLVYNATAGVLLISIYDYWNEGAYPWQWDRARAKDFSHNQTILAGVVWVVLAVTVAIALRQLWRRPIPAAGPDDHSGPAESIPADDSARADDSAPTTKKPVAAEALTSASPAGTTPRIAST